MSSRHQRRAKEAKGVRLCDVPGGHFDLFGLFASLNGLTNGSPITAMNRHLEGAQRRLMHPTGGSTSGTSYLHMLPFRRLRVGRGEGLNIGLDRFAVKPQSIQTP